MKRLVGIHAGQTASIVGKGPSLLHLTASDFPEGPVLTLNHAIIAVRKLRLPNPIYVMEKDGCVPHVDRSAPVPLGCICPSDRMVPPIEPETILLSAAESSRCFPEYPRRVVFDVQRDFGLRWHTMSAVVAIRIVSLMGCRSVRMLAMDAWTTGDTRRVDDGKRILPGSPGYRSAGQRVAAFASETGMSIEWI